MSMAAIILACLLPISCGHNSRQSVGGESEELEEIEVEESNSKGGLMPVPVYYSSNASEYATLCIALMNPNTGELVQFDNDEDYSGYCAFAALYLIVIFSVTTKRYSALIGMNSHQTTM